MSNLLIGGRDPRDGRPFAYYETLAGGHGAGPGWDGASALQAHMTNTRNTPVEALEHAYPLRAIATRIRQRKRRQRPLARRRGNRARAGAARRRPGSR